jgi:hypothetical protein
MLLVFWVNKSEKRTSELSQSKEHFQGGGNAKVESLQGEMQAKVMHRAFISGCAGSIIHKE